MLNMHVAHQFQIVLQLNLQSERYSVSLYQHTEKLSKELKVNQLHQKHFHFQHLGTKRLYFTITFRVNLRNRKWFFFFNYKWSSVCFRHFMLQLARFCEVNSFLKYHSSSCFNRNILIKIVPPKNCRYLERTERLFPNRFIIFL